MFVCVFHGEGGRERERGGRKAFFFRVKERVHMFQRVGENEGNTLEKRRGATKTGNCIYRNRDDSRFFPSPDIRQTPFSNSKILHCS